MLCVIPRNIPWKMLVMRHHIANLGGMEILSNSLPLAITTLGSSGSIFLKEYIEELGKLKAKMSFIPSTKGLAASLFDLFCALSLSTRFDNR